MFRTPVPVKDYEQLASQFNPVKYNADEWVALAQGRRHEVHRDHRRKHHDGFAMFHPPSANTKLVDATPFKRDVLKELADACARQGMRLGFYYAVARTGMSPTARATRGISAPMTKRTTTSTCAVKRSRRSKSCSRSTGRWR
jgi:alpha-L-fucosidase